jgi:hypothetical protein
MNLRADEGDTEDEHRQRSYDRLRRPRPPPSGLDAGIPFHAVRRVPASDEMRM